ncbi:MAG: hypothetical protein H7831_09895 [Magnetococcus sp. WYHC-3]
MKQAYEGIALPDEQRGNVANYSEHIWESPIMTSAGDTHFSGQSKNYFGHTRIEDMADMTDKSPLNQRISGNDRTRRIIEVQSDLYQKGALESEIKNATAYDDLLKRGIVKKKLDQANRQQISKLQQYNDPTAHFRMVREEIKLAAQDGKTKLQFPTGETAMKIEGLGESAIWVDPNKIVTQANGEKGNYRLKIDDLKVGQETQIGQPGFGGSIYGEGDKWVITDILGDGKFRAMPKDVYDAYLGKNKIKSYLTPEELKLHLSNKTETFDISGKVDTSNPIYKFYESELAKYLKKIKPETQRITDNKGVEWFEVPITKEDGERPVVAFRGKSVPYRSITGHSAIKQMREIASRLKLTGLDMQVVDTIINNDGGPAFAASLGGQVVFEKVVPEFAAHHELTEILYRNIENIPLFRRIKKSQLNSEIYEKYRLTDEYDIAHQLSTDLETYAQEITSKKPTTITGKIKEFFDTILGWIKRVVGRQNKSAITEFYDLILNGKAGDPTLIRGPTMIRNTAVINGKRVVNFYGNTQEMEPAYMEAKKEDDKARKAVQRFTKDLETEDYPEEVKRQVLKEVREDVIQSTVAGRFSSEDIKEYRALASIFKRNKKLQSGDVETFLAHPTYGKRLRVALQEITTQMQDPTLRVDFGMTDEDAFEELMKLAQYKPSEISQNVKDDPDVIVLSDHWKEKLLLFNNPPAKNVPVAFALLGNKKTTVPLYKDLFDNWAKSGVKTIIEPWGGAFTLPTHAIPSAIDAGLKEFHSNIYDAEKLIITNTIKDGGIDKVKTSVDRAIKRLTQQIITESKNEPTVEQELQRFMKEVPNSYIGSDEFAKWSRRGEGGGVFRSVTSKIKNLNDYYASWALTIQEAINKLWNENVKTLDDAVMFSLLKRINLYSDKGQNLVTRGVGIQTKQGMIYGKYGMVAGLEDIDRLFKKAKDKGTQIILHSEDSGQMVKKFSKLDNASVGWLLDPPYVNEAVKVYKKQAREKGDADSTLEQFTTGKKLFESHQEIFESINKGARVVMTNGIDTEYLDTMEDKLEGVEFLAYRQGVTPTSMIVDQDSRNTVETFLSRAPEKARITDEEYLSKRLSTLSGYTDKLIDSLIARGVKQEQIDQLRIEGRYLKGLVKVKREQTGRVSAVISKEALNYLKRNYKGNVSEEWIKRNSPKAIGREVGDIIQGVETGSRFFRRLSTQYTDANGDVHTEGLKNLVFDPIRQGERLAKEMEDRLRKVELASVNKLNKSQAKQLWRYTMIKQGKMANEPAPALTFNTLDPKVRKAYMDIRQVVEKYYPLVKEAGNIRGLDVGRIANYTPLYTNGDLKKIDEGGMDWTRKDPFFGSTKERLDNVPMELYEQDYRKVIDHWISGLSRYIEVGKRTVPVKYLIDSQEFRDIVGDKVWTKISEWYRYLVNPPRVEGIWKGVRILRNLQATAILGIKDSVVMKQFLNLLDFRASIMGRRLVMGGIENMRKSQLAKIAKESGSIVERSAGLTVQDLKGTIIKFMQKPTVWADRLTAKMGMVGVMDQMMDRLKKQGKELTPDEFKRIKRMSQDVVDAVMGGMSRAETPRVFRTEGGKNLFMFYSQLNSKMQYYVSDIFSGKYKFLNELSGTHKKLLARAITTMILGAYLEAVISSLSFGDDPEEISKDTLKTLVGNFPLLGNLWYMFETGEGYDVSPILGNLVDIAKALKDGKTGDAIWAGTAFFGMPQQVKKVSQGIEIVSAGGMLDDKGKYKFRVETTMDKIRTILRGKWASEEAQRLLKKNTTSKGKYNAVWSQSQSKELEQFEAKFGTEELKKANDEFNTRVNNMYNSDKYKNMPANEQEAYATKQKDLIKKDIFKKHNFKAKY